MRRGDGIRPSLAHRRDRVRGCRARGYGDRGRHGWLWRLLGWRRPINHVFDDWIFSREFVYGRRPRMDARIDRFSERILDRVRDADIDEVVIVGHCLGAALVMDTVARALKRDPELSRRGPYCVSSPSALPLLILVASARRTHSSGHRSVAEEPKSVDRIPRSRRRYQFLSLRSRYILKRVSRERSEGRPNIRRVQLHDMMDKASFRRHRFNFMLLHYKFLMGNSVRANYDHCLIVCGPLPFDEITVPRGGVDRFGEDGSLLKRASSEVTAATTRLAGAAVGARKRGGG